MWERKSSGAPQRDFEQISVKTGLFGDHSQQQLKEHQALITFFSFWRSPKQSDPAKKNKQTSQASLVGEEKKTFQVSKINARCQTFRFRAGDVDEVDDGGCVGADVDTEEQCVAMARSVALSK